MANNLCRPVTEVPDYLVGVGIVPTGVTLYPGDIILANTLTGDISGNISVFAATKILTATLGEQMAIIINGGFEQLSDGRRPAGQPDYTQYSFPAGETFTMIFLAPQLRFEISYDAIIGTPAVGNSLYPTNNSYDLTKGAVTPSGTFSSLKVLALKYFRVGGQFGGQAINTVIAIVKNPTA